MDVLYDRTSGTLVSASIHDRHVELIRSECMPSVSHLDHVHLLHRYSSARYDDLCPISLGLMQWSHILGDDPYLHRSNRVRFRSATFDPLTDYPHCPRSLG